MAESFHPDIERMRDRMKFVTEDRDSLDPNDGFDIAVAISIGDILILSDSLSYSVVRAIVTANGAQS